MYLNNPSLYDIVSMANRFHIGFYAKCKKEIDGCCIFRLEEEISVYFILKPLQKTLQNRSVM